MIFYNSIHVQGVLYLGMEIVCFEASLIFHLDIRKLLVEFIGLNCSLFRAYVIHYLWRSHWQEIIMFGGHMQKYLHRLSIFPFLCLLLWREVIANIIGRSIFNFFNWFSCHSNDLDHVEICHVNRNHYDVVINAVDSSLPKTVPYNSTASSSQAVNSIINDWLFYCYNTLKYLALNSTIILMILL